MIKRFFIVAIGCVLLFSQHAWAQVNLERFERQIEQIRREQRLKANEQIPTSQRVLVDVGGAFTFNVASIDDLQGDEHVLNQYILTGYGRVSFDDAHKFFVRGHIEYIHWHANNSFDGHTWDLEDPRLDRAYYEFDLQRAAAAYEGEQTNFNFKVRAGRQLVHWANGLVLSEELDGAVFTLGYDPISIDFLAATTVPDIVDFDYSRPEFDNHTARNFFGAMLKFQATDKHTLFAYGLMQDDNNDDAPLTYQAGTAAVFTPTANFQYQSWYWGVGSSGILTERLLYSFELVYQGGESLSRPFITFGTAAAQTSNKIEAYAGDFRLDYLFTGPNRTRLSAEYLFASGDDDRLESSTTTFGNTPNTSDTAFNGFGLINTGMAFGAAPSNLMMLRMGISTFPLPNAELFKRFQIGLDVFLFGKMDKDAPIDEATSDDFFLGTEVDIYINWQVTSDVAFTARYGVFFPGAAIGDNSLTLSLTDNLTDDKPRHFIYSGITLAF